MTFLIRAARPADVPQILAMVRELAEFEKLLHLVQSVEADFDAALFGPHRHVEALVVEARDWEARGGEALGFGSGAIESGGIETRGLETRAVESSAGSVAGEPALMAFALYFHNFSTFLGRSGLYLEDLYVRPAFRRQGVARALMQRLAGLALERNCGRFEWSVLDWNQRAIDFYEGLGAQVLPDWRIVRVTGSALRTLAA